MADIFIMGSGGFGIALAVMANQYSNNVTLWSPFEQEAEYLEKHREHEKLLKDIKIANEIKITTSVENASKADLVIIATPSFAVRATAKRLKGLLKPDTPVACVAKGFEGGESTKTLSVVMQEELEDAPIVILSGPSHAEEVARGVPTTVVAASRKREAAQKVQDILMNETFRIYVNDDVLGVELGGALKNVIALAAGMIEGLGAGDNTKAALMTRGIKEIARLGGNLGASYETFGGLSGIGDLIVTCSSVHSRNRSFGVLMGQGCTVEEALEKVGKTVEGYPCTKSAYFLAKSRGVDMPIVNEVYNVLYSGKSVEEGITDLMARPKKHEHEDTKIG